MCSYIIIIDRGLGIKNCCFIVGAKECEGHGTSDLRSQQHGSVHRTNNNRHTPMQGTQVIFDAQLVVCWYPPGYLSLPRLSIQVPESRKRNASKLIVMHIHDIFKKHCHIVSC